MQFVPTKQFDPEGLEVVRLVALEGNAGRDLQAGISEFLAGSYSVIVRVADNDARSPKIFGRDAFETVVREE
jgi:hypothetical protein